MALTEINSKSIKDGDITEDDIAISNAPADGKFLQYKDSSDKLTWTTVSSSVLSDTSPQLGGDLATNGNEILVADNDEVRFGSGIDMTLKSDGALGHITVDDTLKVSTSTLTDALTVDAASVQVRSGQLISYADFVVGSPTTGQRHYLAIAEDAANGTNSIRFYAPSALTNTQTYYLWTTAPSEGQYLKMGANAAMEWGDAGAGATGGGTEKIFWENGTTIDTDYTVGTSFDDTCNAMSAGPITINTGKTVTVNAGDTWTIV